MTQSWLVPVEGFLVDRLGARIVVAVGGLLVGLSWVGSGLAQSLRALYTWYVLGGVGVGAVYGACVGTVLKWFPDSAASPPASSSGPTGPARCSPFSPSSE